MSEPALIALFGPTGVGKTAVATAVAERLRERGEDAATISADALQVYAGLETLTGAADAAPGTRLISFLPVTETCTAGRYAALAHAEIDAARAEGRRPLVVGGTGLYLRAALTELDLRPPPPPGLRERIAADVERIGVEAAHAALAARAPEAAATIDPRDRRRVTRALELLEAGHDPPGGDQLWTAHTRVPTALFGLVADRAALDEAIDARVAAMVAAGAGEEVERAAAGGASDTARKALGFAELLAGDVGAMKSRTRRYARRQLTWMRKLAGVRLVDVTARAPGDVAAEVLDNLPA
jgi:tRNA dimethylallyltransferase